MCNVVSSLCGNFSRIISLGSGFLIRKLPLGTRNILLWWYTPCFCDGNGGGGDNGVTLLVTLLGAVIVMCLSLLLMLGIGGIALVIVQWYYSVSLVAVCDCCDKQ